jgi:hypothetical protein
VLKPAGVFTVRVVLCCVVDPVLFAVNVVIFEKSPLWNVTEAGALPTLVLVLLSDMVTLTTP